MPTASTASAHDRPAARGCATASSSRASAFAYVLSGRADVGHPRERKVSEPLLVDPLIDTGGGGGPLIGGGPNTLRVDRSCSRTPVTRS